MDINQILDQAETSHRSGNLPEAAGLYRKVLAQNPDHGDALYGLGTILLQQKEYPTAQEYLQKAVNILPDVPEFLFNLALIQEITGDIKDAQANYCHAALNAGDRGPFLLQICKKMIGLDLARQALPYLNAIHPQTPEVVWWKSRAQGAIGYWGSALKNLSWLTKKFPKDTTLWREHSVAAGHMRDFDLAITSFYTYMANKTVDGHDFLALADLYLMARKPDDAQEAIQKAFDLGLKNKADAFFIAGKCARLRGDYKAVRKNLDKAVILRPTFGKAWQMLFEIMDKDEIAPQADRCSSLAKDQNCTDRDRISLALATGQAYEKIDQFGKAFMAFEQANDSHKNLLENQGHIYDPHEAEEEAKKLLTIILRGLNIKRPPKNSRNNQFSFWACPALEPLWSKEY